MAEQDIPEMPSDFARWLGETCVGLSAELVEARWAGAGALSLSEGRDMSEAMVRIAFASKKAPTPTMLQQVRQTIHDGDETFQMSGNDKELQVMVAAALVARMSASEDAAETALLVSTATFQGLRKPSLPMDLGALAASELLRLADTNRIRPALSSFAVKGGTNVDKDVTTKAQGGDFPGAIGALVKATNTALTNLATMHARAMAAVEVVTKVQDEELQMLWWLIGDRSQRGVKFDAIPDLERPLVLAKELSDMTEYLPGPRSIGALLAQASVKDKGKVPVAEAINALSDAWVDSVVTKAEYSALTAPLHSALVRRQETSANDSWIAGWLASTGLAKIPSLTPLALGGQFYRESILFSAGN